MCKRVDCVHYYCKSVVGTYELRAVCVGAMSWYHILFIIHLYGIAAILSHSGHLRGVYVYMDTHI